MPINIGESLEKVRFKVFECVGSSHTHTDKRPDMTHFPHWNPIFTETTFSDL